MADQSQTVLYSLANCLYCHRARLVLAEKAIDDYHVVEIDPDEPAESLALINPNATVPALVDRGVAVHGARTLVEYLDERYPYPPLMPIDPPGRAQHRMLMTRIEEEFYPHVESLELGEGNRRQLRRGLTDHLTILAGDLGLSGYVGEQYSLVDCTLAPVLWRIDRLRLELGSNVDRKFRRYAERVFNRPAFKRALSPAETRMALAASR